MRFSGKAQNISKHGMFVVAEGESPKVGTEVAIKFEDPREGQVEIKMEVVWRGKGDSDSPGAGLGLRALESTDKTAFERVVIRHLEEQGSED